MKTSSNLRAWHDPPISPNNRRKLPSLLVCLTVLAVFAAAADVREEQFGASASITNSALGITPGEDLGEISGWNAKAFMGDVNGGLFAYGDAQTGPGVSRTLAEAGGFDFHNQNSGAISAHAHSGRWEFVTPIWTDSAFINGVTYLVLEYEFDATGDVDATRHDAQGYNFAYSWASIEYYLKVGAYEIRGSKYKESGTDTTVNGTFGTIKALFYIAPNGGTGGGYTFDDVELVLSSDATAVMVNRFQPQIDIPHTAVGTARFDTTLRWQGVVAVHAFDSDGNELALPEDFKLDLIGAQTGFNYWNAVTQVRAAVSRKSHGGAGTFDIDLPLSGDPGVECRNTGGNHKLVFSFNRKIVSGNASLTSGTGTIMGSPTFSGKTMTVNLTGVANRQTLEVTLANVRDIDSQVLLDTPVRIGVLIGDTTANGAVNASDISQTKSKSGQAVNATNFRADVTANGSINSSDIGLVKSKSGTGLPP